MIQLELFPEQNVRVQITYGYDCSSQMVVSVKANGLVITSPWSTVTSLLEAFPIIGKCVLAIFENRHDVGYIEVVERTWKRWVDLKQWPDNTDFDYEVLV